MAEPGPIVPTYSYMEKVQTLRDLPNININKDTTAVRIPSADGNDDSTKSPETISYDKLQSLVESTATQLCQQTGLGTSGPGDIVSIVMPNTIPFILSFLGVPYTRSVSAPLNPNYTQQEYQFYMEDNQCQLVLVPEDDGKNGNPAAEAAASALGLSVYSIGYSFQTGKVSVTHKSGPQKIDGRNAIKDEISAQQQQQQQQPESSSKKLKLSLDPQPSDVALFLHTSGTTAKPKGVPLTHENLIASLNNIATTYQLTPADSVLLIMPLFHVHGLMSALLTTLATGGTVILPPQTKFSASKFYHNAQTATWVTCVPTIYQVLLLRYDQDYPLEDVKKQPKFRFVRSCSSALAPSVLKEIETKFNCPCVEAYAMTEASHQMCSNPIEGQRKPGTVGKGTGVDVAILDSNSNVVEEPNVEGEVCIRGKNVTSGYIGVTEEVNAEAFAGGWFHTGDQGKLDEDGYLTLTGRIKELINRGGEKISPLEVDAAMLSHPDVAEAVSFAKPDEKYGEVVAAAIVLKDNGGDQVLDEIALKKFLVDKLSTFKIPVQVFFDTKLPKTATGKIQRRIVAAHFLSN